MAEWLTVDEVAAYLGESLELLDANNLGVSTAAVVAAVEQRRSDLIAGDPPAFVPTDDVKGGATMWAALIYQTRNAPEGFSAHGDETILYDALGARRAEIMRLIGWRRPVAY